MKQRDDENKEKFQFRDCYLIQYQILRTTMYHHKNVKNTKEKY